jgi:N-glycosylase/DNA lyase
MKRIDQKTIDELRGLHERRQEAICERLKDFSRVPSSEYFYELIYCLMTPQSSAVHADSVVAVLRAQKFREQGFNPEAILRQKEHYIRFHRNKSKYLLRIRLDMDRIADVLTNGHSGEEMREWLVKNVKGLGYKEATHFLRNIGRNSGLAILDRHILRNLKRYGAIRTIPKTLSKKEYFRIERRFRDFADAIGIPIDELDLLFWSMETGEIRK